MNRVTCPPPRQPCRRRHLLQEYFLQSWILSGLRTARACLEQASSLCRSHCARTIRPPLLRRNVFTIFFECRSHLFAKPRAVGRLLPRCRARQTLVRSKIFPCPTSFGMCFITARELTHPRSSLQMRRSLRQLCNAVMWPLWAAGGKLIMQERKRVLVAVGEHDRTVSSLPSRCHRATTW